MRKILLPLLLGSTFNTATAAPITDISAPDPVSRSLTSVSDNLQETKKRLFNLTVTYILSAAGAESSGSSQLGALDNLTDRCAITMTASHAVNLYMLAAVRNPDGIKPDNYENDLKASTALVLQRPQPRLDLFKCAGLSGQIPVLSRPLYDMAGIRIIEFGEENPQKPPPEERVFTGPETAL